VPIDVDRLRRELEFVTAAPDRWEQGSWFELPGDYEDAVYEYTAVHDATRSVVGLPVASPDDAEPGVEPGADWSCGTTACLAGWTAFHADHEPSTRDDHVVAPDGRVVLVRDAARDLLGLTATQASYLFSGENNLRDLWELARVFTDGAVAVPAALLDEPPFTFDPGAERQYRWAGDEA
jgi:hypothetical protein